MGLPSSARCLCGLDPAAQAKFMRRRCSGRPAPGTSPTDGPLILIATPSSVMLPSSRVMTRQALQHDPFAGPRGTGIPVQCLVWLQCGDGPAPWLDVAAHFYLVIGKRLVADVVADPSAWSLPVMM